MPIVVIAGDFLQIKPAADISIAEDYEALQKAGKKIHDEHDVAQRAILNIPDVIHLRKTKRFLDDDMPALMQAIRASLEEDPISEHFLDKLRGRKIENCSDELNTPLFQDGHVVGMYWENVARSMNERAHRDAIKLNVPLYCLQASDQRATYRNPHEAHIAHALLTVPNIHKTGKLHGLLLLHEAMIVRLSDVLAPHCGLVKDKLAKVVQVVLHEHDRKRLENSPPGFQRFTPRYHAMGIWVQLLRYTTSPLSEHITSQWNLPTDSDKAMANSMIFIELHNADFKHDVKIDEHSVRVEVQRWQFPLTHGMIRTAYSAQGLTLEGGVVVDLRRAGGLQDDDWFLAIYVMLSRAQRLRNMILLGFAPQVEDILRRGPPKQLRKITAQLEARAEYTLAPRKARIVPVRVYSP